MAALGDVVVTIFLSPASGHFHVTVRVQALALRLDREKEYFEGPDFASDMSAALRGCRAFSAPIVFHCVDKVVRARLDELRGTEYEPCKFANTVCSDTLFAFHLPLMSSK